MDVECSISGHPTSQKMLSAHEGPPDESSLGDDLVGGDEEYELTELKNVETERGDEKPLVHYDSPDELEHLEEMAEEEEENLQSTSDDNYSRSIKFDIHLANAVSHYPSLYDPLDSNFKSNNYRAQVWKKIAESLLWQNDIMSLQKKWKQLKERYIKRFEREESQMESEFQPLWSRMKWLDRHILPTHERTIITHSIPHHSQSQPTHSTQRTFYVDEPQTVAQDVMIGGGQTQPAPSYSSSHRESSSHVGQGASSAQGELRSTSSSNSSSGGTSYYLLKNSNSQSGHLRLVSDVPGGGPAGRVTVIPATRTSNGTAVVQLPPGNYPRNQRVQIIHTPTSTNTSYEHRVNVGDPGVTVTERGSVGRPIQLVKKGSESLLLDNGDYYQSGNNEQKFIRVIPMHDGINVNQPQSKRMRLIRAPNPSNQVNIVTMNPSTSRHTVPMTTLGEEVIIDDGVTDRIVIDQDVTPESPLLSESPGIGSMMLSGHPSLGPPSPSSHPGYLQQSQYDADLQFQQQISSRLTAYDENEKALIKFHIQRILLEARYGQGIIKSILQDEVDLEAGTNGVSHELISQ